LFSELYAAVLGDAVAYVAEADGRVVGMAEVRSKGQGHRQGPAEEDRRGL